MFTRRPLSALSSAEQQWLKPLRLQSRQCTRCFHASQRRHDEESSKKSSLDASTSSNAPKRGRSRQQRAAQVSDEISMLQKGPPPPGDLTGPGSATDAPHAPPKAPTSSAGFLETPDDMGGPRMGENVSAGREGPNAQGVGRPMRYEDRGDAPQDTSILARGVRTSKDVEEPSEGGESVMGGMEVDGPRRQHREWVERGARQDAADAKDHSAWTQGQEKALRSRVRDAMPLGVPYNPVQPLEKDLLQDGRGMSSTILGKNFEGVISDRFRITSTPSSPNAKMIEKKWNSISTAAQRTINGRMVAGEYDSDGLMTGVKYKQPVLNDMAKKMMLNGSYLTRDAERVLKKVQGLLPAAAAAKQKQKQKQQA